MMRAKVRINKNSHLLGREHLIRTLYKWAHLDKPIPACYKEIDDELSNKWGEKKLQTLVLKVSAKTKVSFADKDDDILEQDTKRGERLGSPTKNIPMSISQAMKTTRHMTWKGMPPKRKLIY